MTKTLDETLEDDPLSNNEGKHAVATWEVIRADKDKSVEEMQRQFRKLVPSPDNTPEVEEG